MKKRGQITVFIIIGIVVLAVVSGIVYVSKYSIKEELSEETGELLTINPIKLFIETCLEESVIEGIYLVSAQGGYYDLVDVDLFDFEETNLELPYYFYGQKSALPSLNFIEKETSKATKVFLENCIGGFEVFKKEGYQIEAGEEVVTIEFKEQNILGELRWPLTIIKGDTETQVDHFWSKIDLAFPEKYNIIKEYLGGQEENPDYFLAGDMSWLSFDNGFAWVFDQYQDDGSDVVVDLKFDEELKKEPLLFSFALNYDWMESEVTEEEPWEPELFLEKPERWLITESGMATYQLKAEGEELTFEIDMETGEIDSETGVITLDTSTLENDEYWHVVTVMDGVGRQASAPLYIDININEGNLPTIKSIEKQTTKVGEEFRYVVEAVNPLEDSLLFASYSYLFEIDNQTGEIIFTPEAEEVGIHSVRVDVENREGKMWERFGLEVIE
ncbi:hypothetical protein GOV03_00760 [Candidatus Woesearchaeota archaeon]|nr:hypothetical protein [Candidatus Woesearchaeota archaeon]